MVVLFDVLLFHVFTSWIFQSVLDSFFSSDISVRPFSYNLSNSLFVPTSDISRDPKDYPS